MSTQELTNTDHPRRCNCPVCIHDQAGHNRFETFLRAGPEGQPVRKCAVPGCPVYRPANNNYFTPNQVIAARATA